MCPRAGALVSALLLAALPIGHLGARPVECPPGAVAEDEPDCHDGYVDETNAGCGAHPEPVFTSLSGTPGGAEFSVCGTAGDYVFDGQLVRDTDWYELDVTVENTITFVLGADFEATILLIDAGGGCDAPVTLVNDEAGPFPDLAVVSYPCPAGTYWFWVAPTAFSGVECGSNYAFTVKGLESGAVAVDASVATSTWTRIKRCYR